MPELDERLAAVAAFVPLGACLADIGTDHAKLPLALATSGKIAHAIAVDVNEGPFEAAWCAVQAAALSPGEVNSVAVAGMGGSLISRILADGAAVLQTVETLVLQPQSDAAELRAWLYDNGWHIEEESLVRAGGRLYEILRARRGKKEKPEPILLEVGPCLWQKKPPLLKEHIEQLLFRVRRAREGMEKSARAREGAAYRALGEKAAALEEKLIW